MGLGALIILDGWGDRGDRNANAILQARTPVMTGLMATYPHTLISASAESVGLPPGQMGNSEVGHMVMGAGRIVPQMFTVITTAVRDGSLKTNAVLRAACASAVSSGTALHLIGLVSDGGVHSHMEHLLALIDLAAAARVPRLFLHAFLDGRDTAPAVALHFLEAVEARFRERKVGAIATVSGRYYAMDRDKRWDRTRRAFEAMTEGKGLTAASAAAAVEAAYARGETDEFVQPTVVTGPDGRPLALIRHGDSVLNFNFRPDRARQMTRALTDPAFADFPRGFIPKIAYTCLTRYEAAFPLPVAFPPVNDGVGGTVGDLVARRGLAQWRIAETEKYAHVTYFFSGGHEDPFPGETRRLIPSPKVATYDLQPAMSASGVLSAALEALNAGANFLVVNFANCDMVGHTGVLPAAVRAVETVDACVGTLVEAIRARGGWAVITADHGNAELMVDEQGRPHTAHTTSLVPVVIVSERAAGASATAGRPSLRAGGSLVDIAPTLLDMLEWPVPKEMTGTSLWKI